MKILILGGNRFFGRRLAEKLSSRYEVTLLNRQNLDDGLGVRVKRIKADRANPTELAQAVRKSYDVVYDQICYEPQQAREALEIFTGRATRYIFTSSMSVYGSGADQPETAFDPYSFKFSQDSKDYAEAKRQCEAVFFAQTELPVTAIRFPIVCGEDDYTRRLQWHVDHVKNEKPMLFPNLDAHLSLIHAKDAAEILMELAKEDFKGPLNVCADEPIQLRKLIETIESKVGRKAKFGGQDESPYGIESNWSMSTETLRSLNLRADPILNWLPSLV